MLYGWGLFAFSQAPDRLLKKIWLQLPGLVSSGVALGLRFGCRRRRRLALSPQEEVPVSSSYFSKGLLIVENAA